MAQEPEVPEVEVLPPARRGMSDADMLQVAIDSAKKYPRDVQKVMRDLKGTLDMFPQFAEEMLYSIGYQSRRLGKEVKVEGLTIRAAETLASAWGNMRYEARITSEDDDGWNLAAYCWDMESNVSAALPSRALKTEKSREGRLILLDERRQLQARGSAVSKVVRNAILSVIPLYAKAAMEVWVREKMAGGELSKTANPARVADALAKFEKDFKVSPEQLERYVGKPRNLWVGDDLADLKSIYNGLKSGDATVAETFIEPGDLIVEVQGTPHPITVVEAKDGQLEPPEPPIVKPARPDPRPMPDPPQPPTPRPEPPTVGSKTPPAGSQSFMEALPEAVASATTFPALDTLLGKLYDKATNLSREDQRAALRVISKRRAEIQKGDVTDP